MIPHRTLDDEIFGNGVSARVAACRKRLRINRSTPKALVQNEPEEVIEETAVSVSEFDKYPSEHRVMRKYLICNDYCSLEFEGAEPRDGESLLLVGKQEVGIT